MHLQSTTLANHRFIENEIALGLLDRISEQSELSEHESECLLGTWEAESNSFHSSIANSLQFLDNSPIQYLGTTGRLLLIFDRNEQYTAIYEELTHNFQSKFFSDSEEESIPIKVRFEGQVTASIAKNEDDSILSYSNVDYGVTLTIEAPEHLKSFLQDGASIDSNLSSSDLLNSPLANLNLPIGKQLTDFLEELEQFNQVSYICDRDNLEITNRVNIDSSKSVKAVRRFQGYFIFNKPMIC